MNRELRGVEITEIEPERINSYKMKKFESIFLKIYVRGKKLPLNIAMSKDEAGSGRGIETFWSEDV